MTTDPESDSASAADQLFEALRAKAKRNMIVGGLWCVGGTIVTVLTYAAAQEGGTYTIAWGAIIFGGIQFFRGLAEMDGLVREAPAPQAPVGLATPTVPAIESSVAARTSGGMAPPLSRAGSSDAIEPRTSSNWVWWGIASVLVVFFIYLALQIKAGKLPW
jgi:hypothetical protein